SIRLIRQMHNKINPINVPLELGSSPKNTGDMKKFNINMIIARLTNTLLMKNTPLHKTSSEATNRIELKKTHKAHKKTTQI
ncbi:hypothetical protein, partial [Peribacillus butanolivorans]